MGEVSRCMFYDFSKLFLMSFHKKKQKNLKRGGGSWVQNFIKC